MPDWLQPLPAVRIPLSEVVVRTSRSGGPGGQHANVTDSRVDASFDVQASQALTDAQKARIADSLGSVVRAGAQDERSQLRNRELALERLETRLAAALRPTAPRLKTRVPKRAKRKRLDDKSRRATTKQGRREPDGER